MLNTYTIGRIGKDCQVISGKHGSFVALDMAVDDYQKGESTTTWVRVKSSKENHIKLSEYLTKGSIKNPISGRIEADEVGSVTYTEFAKAPKGACEITDKSK